jgi:hypothetical protein
MIPIAHPGVLYILQCWELCLNVSVDRSEVLRVTDISFISSKRFWFVDGYHSVDEYPSDFGVYVVNVVKTTADWFGACNVI